MLTLDAKAVAQTLPYEQLIAALETAFRGEICVPQRSHHEFDVPGGDAATLLLMPAWQPGRRLGVKVATVFPDNARHGKPAIHASYLLLSAATGVPLALLEGTELTLRRTAAASALASSYLSRRSATKLLMVGTGAMAPHLVAAHAVVRGITDVCIWGRRPSAAAALADKLAGSNFRVTITENLEDAVGAADIISCATLAVEPLIMGSWLQDGQHLDLIGAFKPEMREVDEAALLRAKIYVDTRSGAFAEAGEIVQAIRQGVLTEADICGELAELARGSVPGRQQDHDITLFKSVGTALEDLAAAELAMQNFTAHSPATE